MPKFPSVFMEHPDTLETKNDLAVLYEEQPEYDKAEPLLLETIKGCCLKIDDNQQHILESWKKLIDLYEARNKPEEAEKWRAKLPQTETKNVDDGYNSLVCYSQYLGIG